MRIRHRLLAGLASGAAAAALMQGTATAASDRLAGTWVSDSLRDNRIGYYLVLRDAPGRAVGYVGHLRFQRQDGSREPRMRVTAAVSASGIVITAREGSFDRAGRTLIGRLDGRGTLVLTNCSDRLRQVMSWDLASDCTLRLNR
jgi:hypothetical protein